MGQILVKAFERCVPPCFLAPEHGSKAPGSAFAKRTTRSSAGEKLHAGAPRELTYYAELLEYYRALAAASPRVSIMSAGRTDEDREMVVVIDCVGGDDPRRAAATWTSWPAGPVEMEAAQVIA